MRSLENLVIDTLSDFDINADRKHKLTGVWVMMKKYVQWACAFLDG